MKRKLFSLLALLMVAVTGAWAQTTYTVAGSNAAMFGSVWDPTYTANDMTKNGDGTYSITYTNVYLDNNVQYKVVKNHSWDEAYPALDRVINIAEAGTYTLTIHFNPTTHEVYETMPGVIPTYDLKVGTNAQGTVKFYVGQDEVTKAKEGETVTIVVTPDDGWSIGNVTGQWIAAMAKAPRRTAGIGLLQDVDVTFVSEDAQTGAHTYTFVMQRANAEISVTYKKLLTNSDITVQDITALTYTGVAQEPTVTVKDGTAVLTKDVDYTVAYSNNTNAALSTATENAPTVTITAVATSEKYSGETTKKFTINKKALTVTADNKSVTFGDDAPTYTESYDGFVNNETKAVLGGTLALTCDYVKNQTAAGTYDITPSGLTSSNYDITFTKGTLTVGKKALEDGFIANIASLVYNGVAQEPAPVVTFNGMTLVAGTDYSVSYENNVNVGTATATVTALANSTKYSGTASKTFSITKKALTVKADNKSVTFGDDAPTYTESYDGFVNNETKAVLGGTLALACTYVKDQSGVGTYDITPSGYTSDNYDITFTKGTLTVGTKALEDGFIADIDALTYTSEAQTPAPVLTFHEMTLVAGTDYTVAYSNNVNAGTATVKVTAKEGSNYSGEASATFNITPAQITSLTLAQTEFVYNLFDPQAQTAQVGELKAGELVVPATDYDISDNTATDLGDYVATVTAKNNFQGVLTADYHIVKEKMDVVAGDSKTGKETGGVTMTVTVVDRTSQRLSIDVVNVPENKKVTVEIPAQINGWDVTAISDGAVPDNVTDVFMPNTGENPITVSDAALGIAKVHVPVQLLDDYAAQLAQHVEVKKLVSEVTQTTKRFWTFSSGVDVELQKELSANIVKIGKSGELISQPIGSQIVKANNGVMLEGEQDTEYELVALPAVSLGNDYEGNLLEPVIASKHYAAGQGYYVLKNGEFHAIADNNASMPSCKAVLHMNGNNSRVLKFRGIDDETSGIGAALIVKRGAGAVYYDLNGRQLNGVPTQKGVYILNGRKVVIK